MKMIFLVLSLSSIIFSQGPIYNEEFQINNYIVSDQQNPALVSISNGRFLVCWEGKGDQDDNGIYAKIYNENGISDSGSFLVNTNIVGGQSNPSVSILTNGNIIVTFSSDFPNSGERLIVGQILDESGNKVGNEFQINSNGNPWASQVAGLLNEGFIVCWESNGQDGSLSGIYAQRFNNQGVKIGDEFLVNTYTFNSQISPKICNLQNGGFVIAWTSYGQDASGDGIFAQLFDSNAIKIGNEFRVNTFEWDNQSDASIANTGGSTFVICWFSYMHSATNWGIYGQKFNDLGEKIGIEFPIITYPYEILLIPTIKKLSNDRYLVGWTSWFQDHSWNKENSAQLFNENFSPLGNVFDVNDYKSRNQEKLDICNLANGNIVLCWSSNGQDGSGNGIFAKYYLPDPIAHNLISFNLLSPQTSGTINHNNPNFIWEQASDIHINFPWELTYDLYIDESINFNNPTIYESIQDTTILPDTLTNGQTYYWKVIARTYSGDSLWCSDVYNFYVDPNAVTGIKDIDDPLPEYFILHQNYPNPFNPTTKIKFNIPANVVTSRDLSLRIYDVLGNEITTLVNEQKPPGTYEVEFSADDFSLTSGIYFYKLTVGQFSDTRKMLLIK